MGHALRLESSLPDVVSSDEQLAEAVQALAAAEGCFGVDAERAGSYRYSQRAYLVQIYRRSAPVLLLDPLQISDFSALAELLTGDQWVMQAAHNDLECLAELDLRPASMFDTEIAGQLLGLPKVGLAALAESQLGYTMRKSHGQADWSRRPLKRSWLEYAVLDVLILPDLQEALAEHLDDAGKMQWAREEFAHQMRERPAPDPEQRWRRTASAGRLRSDDQRGALRALWLHRDQIARDRDIAWHRVLRDQVMVEVAKALPRSTGRLAAIPDIPRSVLADAQVWLDVIERAEPQPAPERGEGPPARTLRSWEQRDPAAAARWVAAKAALNERAEELSVWPQLLLTPDIVADLCWSIPDDAAARMRDLGARPWQVAQTVDLFVK